MQPAENCRRCPRLAALRVQMGRQFPDYHNRPVKGWGPEGAPILVVGLAPGLHGANRTGRPFCGDSSGDFLFRHLSQRGLLDENGQPRGIRITNAVKCLPPENRPTPDEVRHCNTFLASEIQATGEGVILALGRIAHDAVLRSFSLTLSAWKFGHACRHQLPDNVTLLDSYHCSRYNTQTKRLTDASFKKVLDRLPLMANERD
jgi:uracil-DNA glycosylase family 4